MFLLSAMSQNAVNIALIFSAETLGLLCPDNFLSPLGETVQIKRQQKAKQPQERRSNRWQSNGCDNHRSVEQSVAHQSGVQSQSSPSLVAHPSIRMSVGLFDYPPDEVLVGTKLAIIVNL